MTFEFDKIKPISFSEFKDCIFTKIQITDNKEEMFFFTESRKFRMFHDQDCCESVKVEDISGDLEDLLWSPILLAEETVLTNKENARDNSCTWTFYKLATIKGYVTIRWLGESNGYYSESVNLEEIYSEDQLLIRDIVT